MTAPLNVVAVASSLIAPSKTTALAELILQTLSPGGQGADRRQGGLRRLTRPPSFDRHLQPPYSSLHNELYGVFRFPADLRQPTPRGATGLLPDQSGGPHPGSGPHRKEQS